jgi:hypothetical protein
VTTWFGFGYRITYFVASYREIVLYIYIYICVCVCVCVCVCKSTVVEDLECVGLVTYSSCACPRVPTSSGDCWWSPR